MNPTTFGPVIVTAAQLEQFDAIEVCGCAYREDEDIVEEVEGNEAPQFWCVFGHLKVGGRDSIADFQHEAEAEAFARDLLERMKGAEQCP